MSEQPPTRGKQASAPAPDRIPITVLAVDDQQVFRRTLASLIEATPDFEQVGEAGSGEEALALAARLRPALVLLDVRMPDMDGIETARRLAAADPNVAIVLISIDELVGRRIDGAPPGTAFVRKQDLSVRKLHETWATISSAS